jgi:hypothetical protein
VPANCRITEVIKLLIYNESIIVQQELGWLSQCNVWLQTRQSGFDPRHRQRLFPSNVCVQTSPEAHPASYPTGIGDSFPGVKRGRGVTLTTQSNLLPRSRMSGSYIPSPPGRLNGGGETALLLLLLSGVLWSAPHWIVIARFIDFVKCNFHIFSLSGSSSIEIWRQDGVVIYFKPTYRKVQVWCLWLKSLHV